MTPPAYPQAGLVAEVSAEADRAWWVKASWPAIGGVHPDWLRPAPGDAYRCPRVGGVVQIERVPGTADEFQWRGEQPPDAADLPAEAKAAVGELLALLPASMRCYLLLDDRAGDTGALRLLTATGGEVSIRNDGARIDVKAPASGGIVRIEGASKIIHEAPTVETGEGATQQEVLGNNFKVLYDAHSHASAFGPTAPPGVSMDVPAGTHLASVGRVK